MRQLNFQTLSIRRMIGHVIHEKQQHEQCSVAELSSELLTYDSEMERLIKRRLQDAMGRKGKGFYLEVANSSPSSFFGISHNLNTADNDEFVRRSQAIATLLAGAQRRASIKSGFLFIIEATDASFRNLPIFIVIKAEPQEALRRNAHALEHVTDLLMSPSQKFYKVGVLYRDDNDDKTYPNDSYSGYVFDEQFTNLNSGLSGYFYSEFLGFDYMNNGPLQTKHFFELTTKFLEADIKDLDKREELAEALRVMVKTDNSELLRPRDFAEHFLDSDEDKAIFNHKVSNEFPDMLQKDTSLLDFTLKTRKIKFNDVQISGPDNDFAENVQVIKNEDQMANLDPKNENYTILKIIGRPSLVKQKGNKVAVK
ncbi:nucleoid-associated protein [Hymenobacter sp. BT730]|uniref:nucleoid-associated protein n=1 Tax=Hymenobacter sp. BT730 TaxID=3063332 RepID=UPI0026DF0AC3|nr:nucleoid-associated protein [Hymenobacter sp. BT730]